METTREEYLNWINRVEAGDRRTFVALDGKRIVAYIDVAEEGETFITYADNMMNIQGAYCMPEYRGKNVVTDLIEYVIGVLEALDTFSQEELFTNTYYPWVGGSCIGSYFISTTSSHYDWAMKKMKAHKKMLG